MLGKRVFDGVNGLAVTDEPCPLIYFPDDPSTEVRRFTRTKDGEPIFFIDYVLRDETLYNLYLEVMPEYRGDEWIKYLDFDKSMFAKGYAEFGKVTKSVWVNTVGSSFPSLEQALQKREKLSREGFIDPSEIFVQGSTMRYIDAREQKPE